MKVLSLTKPFATLIKEKMKLIETRSWKTSYRGKLYIHASMTKMAKHNKNEKELMGLIDNKQTRKEYKNKSEKEIEKIVSKQIALEDSTPSLPRSFYFDENIELDASSFVFF